MASNLTSLDLYYLMKELRDLENSRLDKVFTDDERFVFSFYVFGQGKKYLHFLPPSTMYLSDKKTITSQESGFARILRKYLGGKKVSIIEQQDFERILKIDFGEYKLFFELFDKGNVVIAKKDNTIVSALVFKKFRERTIRGGINYEFPAPKINPLKTDFEDFSKFLESRKDQIVKTLARDFSLGGSRAEELCSIAKVDKKTIAPSSSQKQALYNAFQKMLKQQKTEMSTSKLIEKDVKKAKPPEPKTSPQIKKIETIIKKQKELLQKTTNGYEENNLKGSKIYEHFADIERLLQNIKETKEKQGWDAVKEKLENKKVSINKNSGKITIQIP